jgi:hypothetical protein
VLDGFAECGGECLQAAGFGQFEGDPTVVVDGIAGVAVSDGVLGHHEPFEGAAFMSDVPTDSGLQVGVGEPAPRAGELVEHGGVPRWWGGVTAVGGGGGGGGGGPPPPPPPGGGGGGWMLGGGPPRGNPPPPAECLVVR